MKTPPKSVLLQTEPKAFAYNVSRYLVIAVELTKRDIITASLHARCDTTTATIDWENVIVGSM